MMFFKRQVTWVFVALALVSLVASLPVPTKRDSSDLVSTTDEPSDFAEFQADPHTLLDRAGKTAKPAKAAPAAKPAKAAPAAKPAKAAPAAAKPAKAAPAAKPPKDAAAAKPAAGAACAVKPKAKGKRDTPAKEGDSITVNGFTAKLGKKLSSGDAAVFEVTWKGGVAAIAKQPLSLAKAKFDQEVANTRAAGSAQGNGLFIDSGADACTGINWLIQKKLAGQNILVTFTGANKPTSKADCTAKLAKARSAAVDAQVKLGTAAGFVQGDTNAENYLFNSDFSKCDVIDFGVVRSVKGQSADQIRAGQVKVMQQDSFPDDFCAHIA